MDYEVQGTRQVACPIYFSRHSVGRGFIPSCGTTGVVWQVERLDKGVEAL